MRLRTTGLILALAAGPLVSGPLVSGLLVSGMAAAQTDLRAECARLPREAGYRVCERAVRAMPDDPRLRRFYGLSLSWAGAYDKSIEQFRKIALLTPNDPVAHFEYAWMLAFVRRYPDSVAPIERAIALRPDYRRALLVAAIIYAQLNRARDQLRVVLAAAHLGERIAMFDAYDLYLNGIGTPKNNQAAFDWLRRAAMAGHIGAMDRLVQVHLNGTLGQPQNLKAAARWATRARIERFGGMRAPTEK